MQCSTIFLLHTSNLNNYDEKSQYLYHALHTYLYSRVPNNRVSQINVFNEILLLRVYNIWAQSQNPIAQNPVS